MSKQHCSRASKIPLNSEISTKYNTKKKLLVLAKLFITISLCVVLVSEADWSNVANRLENTSILLSLIVFILLLLSVTISTYKWRLLLSVHGLKYDFSWLQRLYFIAMFFNNFLPTSIGGDGYRIYKTINNWRNKSLAVIAVLMERVTGLGALLFMGYASAIVVFLNNGDELTKMVLAGGAIGTLGAIVLILMTIVIYRRRYLVAIFQSKMVSKLLIAISEALKDYWYNPKKTTFILAISLFFHIHLSVVYYLLLTYGVETSLSMFQLLVVLSLVSLLSFLPISINGIGVVDGAFIYLVGQYGVTYDDAFAVMLLVRALVIPVSIIGGILYFVGEKKQQPQEVSPR